ncbi:glucokinase [Roseobacter weihaiensis]|uniref:glucokinase n=1 Tax=Roseobacter weihaiensis TaxID=2763262 RepID=UPI001D0A8F00|nr:glucokinase [Roseobacter sp. H9]
MAHATPPVFLVADIGGTNTRVALSDGENVLSGTIRRYRNAEHPGLEVVLKQYLAAEGDIVPRAACIAVAGPVRDGKGHLTNLDWDMDEAGLAKSIGAGHVAMLNDLQAQGYALDHVSDADMMLVRQGSDGPDGAPRLVVNLGTGFNASPVFVAPSGPFVATSESGHATMPVRTEQDMRLCGFVARQHGFAAIDDILSGRGLAHIYAFLSHEAGKNDTLTSAAIMEGCASRADPLAVETVAYFTRLTAMVMGNLALVQLPFGGIYMVGGLSSAIAPYMAEFGFDTAFRDKGRFADFMDDFSIYVLQDDYAALKGTAAYLHGLVAQQEQA